MPTQPQKIKVNVIDLIKKIEEFKKKAIADAAKSEKDFEAATAKYSDAVIAVLEKALEAAKKGKLPDTNYSNISVPFRMNKPSKDTVNVKVINADLELLRMSADDAIVVNHDSQWRQYLS